MNLTENREKKFTYATCTLYILGFILGGDYIILALISFCGSAFCAFGTIPLEAKNNKKQQTEIYILIAAFILPALGTLWIGYQDSVGANKFMNYLSEHNCKEIGLAITGYTNGGCDQFDNCEEPHEIEEPEYLCAVTKKRITYSDFNVGHYGQ